MRIRHALLIAGLFTTPTAPAAGQTMPADLPPARQALWLEIQAANDSMAAAFNRGDMRQAAAFFADDGIIQGGGPAIQGRGAIDEFYARSQGQQWRLEVVGIGGGNDLAYQIGTLHVTRQDGRTSSGPFVVIWRRDAAGRLRIAMDLF
jgi:ketosteroid isomerase-like protein